jgi:signal transduction histidine kinase
MSSVDLVAAARRHPRLGDSLIAALVAGACAVILTGATGATVRPARPLDWVCIVVVAVPLIWRRRAPVVVFWTVVLLFWTSLGLGAQSPAGVIVPLTALHALARYRPPAWALPAVCFIIPPGFAARLDRSQSWSSIIALAALSVAVMLIGLSQRTRVAYLAALEDRAERLERDRDQQARLAVADERARIAREMHDVVAHHLTVMTALSEGAAATAPTDPARAATVMTQAAATGREALSEMRRMVGVLRSPGPPLLEPQPGLAELDALIARVRAAGLRVTFTRSGTPGPWGPGPGVAIYRIVQEALTNTLKHAGPHAEAAVSAHFTPTEATLTIRDNGGATPFPTAARPAAPPAIPEGAGLVSADLRGEAGLSAPAPNPASRSAGPPSAALPDVSSECASGLGAASPKAGLGGADRQAGLGGDAESAGRHGVAGMVERAAAYGGELTAGPRHDRAGWEVCARLRFGS